MSDGQEQNGGRHSLLTEEMLGKASGYLATCQDHFSKDSKEVNLPSIEGLAVFLKVGTKTIYNWRDQETDLGVRFLHIVNEVMSNQALRLINNGLSERYNNSIAKLILTKHGYRDESKQEVEGSLPFNIIIKKQDDSQSSSADVSGKSI